MSAQGEFYRRSDLTGFAALLGESFSARIDLLSKIVRGAHYPSLGAYKERILAEAIRNYLPNSLEVGSGFVLFPHEDENPHDYFDDLNQSAYTVSRQCDILIYDAGKYPPVFKDGNFVVLRPESVKAVIEVKGTLNDREVKDIVDGFIDFGENWRRTEEFYRYHHGPRLTDPPALLAMGWSIYERKGRPVISAAKIRAIIARRYSEKVAAEDLDNFPLLKSLMIYNESVIGLCYFPTGLGENKDFTRCGLGWYSQDGRFVRVNSDGELYRDKDRTISWLIAELHLTLGLDNFNRFFSYLDETKEGKSSLYRHKGYDIAWDDVANLK
ncbi:DUF6602 domain-containing protein [uncultured Pseudomonas sp.]|uniref:DUF6602 domain-containing protein n=1 Tax=uncultured Pseudomonas sp. TaxID=114707 RepID=UPI0025DD43C8|nr:DUF6602 domain-containing protein [uncultured Pseudomonas sp.]